MARFAAIPDVDAAYDNFAIEGTIPFSLAISRMTTNEVAVTFPTTFGRQYVTEFTPSLTNASWTAIATNSGIDGIISITNQITAETGFWRVKVE